MEVARSECLAESPMHAVYECMGDSERRSWYVLRIQKHVQCTLFPLVFTWPLALQWSFESPWM